MDVDAASKPFLDERSDLPGFDQSKRYRPVPYYRTTLGFIGLQVVFTSVLGHGVTHLGSLGLNQTEIAVTLLIGPICGAIFQPLFGGWSDRARTPWGRRKPFILLGTIALILSILSLAWADSLASTMTGAMDAPWYRPALMTIIIIVMSSLFVSVQAVQVGLRALITDNCTADSQLKANAFASFYSNFAAMIGNLSAYIDRSHRDRSGNMAFKNLGIISTICLVVTMSVSCVSVKEVPPSTKNNDDSIRSSSRSMWIRILSKPSRLRTIYFVQFLAWTGWFPYLLYTEIYVDSLGPDSSDPQHTSVFMPNNTKTGGSLALLNYSSVALIVALLLPPLVSAGEKITLRHVWIVSHFLFAAVMLATFIVRTPLGTVMLFGVVGFSWAASSWIPFVLLGTEAANLTRKQHLEMGYDDDSTVHKSWIDQRTNLSDQLGLIYGLHNLAICIPQILICIGTGLMWHLSGSASEAEEQEKSQVVWILRFGGVCALVAMLLVIRMQLPVQKSSTSSDEAHLLKDLDTPT